MEIIKYEDEIYPKSLKDISSPPHILYVEGNLELLNIQPTLTVIGSRNMTEYGKKITHNIVEELTNNNVCIISGMAVGIDSVAHKTCIENGGKTIAVLGCGFNKIFPPENTLLYKQILESGGCVISEYPPNTIAQKKFFPQRNRIVSGLSLATLVVEATHRSGTSITADFAFKQNKKVFCVPNSIGNKNSAGTINLLKKGAKVVTCAEDILYELGILQNELNELQMSSENQNLKIEQENLKELNNITKQVYNCIKENGIINSELIANILDLSIQELNIHLSILEIKGLIQQKGVMNFVLS